MELADHKGNRVPQDFLNAVMGCACRLFGSAMETMIAVTAVMNSAAATQHAALYNLPAKMDVASCPIGSVMLMMTAVMGRMKKTAIIQNAAKISLRAKMAAAYRPSGNVISKMIATMALMRLAAAPHLPYAVLVISTAIPPTFVCHLRGYATETTIAQITAMKRTVAQHLVMTGSSRAVKEGAFTTNGAAMARTIAGITRMKKTAQHPPQYLPVL